MTSMTPTRSSLYQQSVNSASSPSSTAPTAASVLSSAAVVGVTVATAVVAAVRCKLKAVRECSCCQGYGVERCKLCSGKGTIQWEGKMAHREPCPMCLGRRLVKCSACGGGIMFSRSLFTHKANKGEEALMETLTTLTAPSRLFGRRAGNEQEEARIAESEEFSKEILTD
jgi:DnaJ-class molecular chaperone